MVALNLVFVLIELFALSRVKELLTVTSVSSALIFCCSSVSSATSLPDPVIFSAYAKLKHNIVNKNIFATVLKIFA